MDPCAGVSTRLRGSAPQHLRGQSAASPSWGGHARHRDLRFRHTILIGTHEPFGTPDDTIVGQLLPEPPAAGTTLELFHRPGVRWPERPQHGKKQANPYPSRGWRSGGLLGRLQPTGMRSQLTREDVEFKSDGLKLRGHLYLPEGIEPPYPTVVMAGGWCYVKELIQPE